MTATLTRFDELQAAELAWWQNFLSHPTAKERMLALYGARYFGFFYREMHDCGAVVEIGSGPLPVMLTMPAKMMCAIDTLWPEYRDAGLVGDWMVGHTDALMLPSQTADTVLLLNVLDHTDDPIQLIDDARRILAPHGRCLVFVHLEQEDEKHMFVREEDVVRWFEDWNCERAGIQHTSFDPPAFVGVFT